ncbi:MAG TPA: gamma-glutamylcyclotransferase [Saprospiraceae bacterium]|nr:gamma-glutamylcyclotransferase [Saprospiraceae bacterium]HMP23380.1 gamma-glutamylcyclotransferase [Saprospiraceae bacterium]
MAKLLSLALRKSMDMHYLFVYGTLMQGLGAPVGRYLHRHADFVGTGWLAGTLYDLGAYPGVVHDPAAPTRVHGQVWRLHDQETVLARLDAYEGLLPEAPESGEYRRAIVPVHCGEQILFCEVYLYNRTTAGLPTIPGGDYREFLRTANSKTRTANNKNNSYES